MATAAAVVTCAPSRSRPRQHLRGAHSWAALCTSIHRVSIPSRCTARCSWQSALRRRQIRRPRLLSPRQRNPAACTQLMRQGCSSHRHRLSTMGFPRWVHEAPPGPRLVWSRQRAARPCLRRGRRAMPRASPLQACAEVASATDTRQARGRGGRQKGESYILLHSTASLTVTVPSRCAIAVSVVCVAIFSQITLAHWMHGPHSLTHSPDSSVHA
jgi:hypothetical protein